VKRARRGNPWLSKAEGMVRFYVEGKRPVAQQDVPEPLRGHDLKEAEGELGTRLAT
jgi:hypothetical protein